MEPPKPLAATKPEEPSERVCDAVEVLVFVIDGDRERVLDDVSDGERDPVNDPVPERVWARDTSKSKRTQNIL